MSITLHIHPEQFKVELGAAGTDHPAYTVIEFRKARDVTLFLDSTAKCDALIAAATEAKRLLTEAQTGHAAAEDLGSGIVCVRPDEDDRLRRDGEALGDRIAADEGIEPEQLYVVWEHFEPGDAGHRHTVVTDPMSKADAEAFAEREAPYFAGRLEVAPARAEDLDDADGEQR